MSQELITDTDQSDVSVVPGGEDAPRISGATGFHLAPYDRDTSEMCMTTAQTLVVWKRHLCLSDPLNDSMLFFVWFF